MEIQPLDVLKWIGIVLAAGFVGYFGRYLAMMILEKVHGRKEQTPAATTSEEKEAVLDSRLEESRLKLEKKKAKQAAKKAKKVGKN